MTKTDITVKLENDISLATSKIGVFGCYEVTIGMGGSERVDYMTLDTKGIWRCYEIKCSVSDFRSKAKKSFVGHYNYFVLTKELYDVVKDEIPKHVGVYVGRKCVKRAVKQDLRIDDNTLKLSFIRSLSREANKYQQSKNPKAIENYNRKISHLENEKNKYRKQYQELKREIEEKFGYSWRR